jgi:hypothetical protein
VTSRMKRTLQKLAVAAAVTFGVVSAQGALHFDIDVIGVEVNSANPYQGVFDITGSGLGKGYDPSKQQIVWAYATFALWDAMLWGGSESLTIELGGNQFDSSGSFLGTILLGDQLLGDVLWDLGADGKLSYEITALSGSFKLLGAELHAKSKHRRDKDLPDSGWTLALLGVAMVGLASVRRK